MGGLRRSSLLSLAVAWPLAVGERSDDLAELLADVKVHSQHEIETGPRISCPQTPTWSKWSACSATCGFAMKSRYKEECGKPRYYAHSWCLTQSCPEERSTVDINNYVTGPGKVAEWSSTNSEDTSSDLAGCIFQFWKVALDASKAPQKFILLGETDGRGLQHPNIHSIQDGSLLVLKPSSYEGVSIGYRNCTPHATGGSSSMAEIDSWDPAWLQASSKIGERPEVKQVDLALEVAALRRMYDKMLEVTLASRSSKAVSELSGFLTLRGSGSEPGTGITARMTED